MQKNAKAGKIVDACDFLFVSAEQLTDSPAD